MICSGLLCPVLLTKTIISLKIEQIKHQSQWQGEKKRIQHLWKWELPLAGLASNKETSWISAYFFNHIITRKTIHKSCPLGFLPRLTCHSIWEAESTTDHWSQQIFTESFLVDLMQATPASIECTHRVVAVILIRMLSQKTLASL